MRSTISYSPVSKSHALSHKEKRAVKFLGLACAFATSVVMFKSFCVIPAQMLGCIVERQNFTAAREVLYIPNNDLAISLVLFTFWE